MTIGDQIRQFIERFERLEAQRKDIVDQQTELMAEAKKAGYDTKVMRKVVNLRDLDFDLLLLRNAARSKPTEKDKLDAVSRMYLESLGM
jgi:uncharacterized protein (UPF0335 family)